MNQLKHKKGDSVVIRKDLKLTETEDLFLAVIHSMLSYSGLRAVIAEVHEGKRPHYKLNIEGFEPSEIENYCWKDSMFEE